MIVRVYEDRPWANKYNVLVLEAFVPNQSGRHTVSLERTLGQSDRCTAWPVDDPEDRAWGYHVGITTTLELDLAINGSNINVDVDAFRDWMVERVPGGTPAGYRLVPGDYSWYSSINGSLIAHYYYENNYELSGWGYESYPGSGGTVSFSSGTIRPQQESSAREYANMYNNVNGNQSFAKIVFFNDFPPDYRPGAIRSGNIYLSHNRDGGEAHILNSSWEEMRTVGGGVEHDNIPSIRKNNSWFNQLKLGKE